MLIKANDRILIAGQTGSGKTFLAKRLTDPIQRLVVVDSKASLKSWSIKEPKASDWKKFEKGGPGRFRILPPIVDDKVAYYEDLFERLYAYGRVTVYIDELYEVTDFAVKPGKWLGALYTRGRERGIGVWACTQRPTWIPVIALSEANWIIMFQLSVFQDRKRIASIAGDKVLAGVTDDHGFWIYSTREREPHYYRTAVQNKQTGL